jgi:hypothetical protein
MKSFAFILIQFLLLSLTGYSQELSPQVIASSGDSYEANGIILSWTLGEPVTETFSAGNVTLTQGFHQGDITVTSTRTDEFTEMNINVYPNPAGEFVNIDVEGKPNEILTVELFSLSGEKVLIRKDFRTEKYQQLQLKDLPAGTYILKIINNEKVKTYKIVKMK